MKTNQYLDDTLEGDAVMLTAAQVLAFLRRHIKKLALTCIIGGAFAAGVALVLPKQWEASAAVQIGQIASETPQSSVVPIETVGRAVERLQLPQFKDVVLQKLGLPLGVGENANADLLRRSLKVTQLKNADLLEVTVRGFSQAEAQRYAKAFLDELVEAHASLAKPSIDKINANMAEVTRSIAVEEARKAQLTELTRARDQAKHAGMFPEAVLLANMTAENDRQLQALRQREISIREQLNPERTFNTRLFGPMFVGRHPVFPNGLIFAAGGLMLGLLLAVGWGLFIDCRQCILRCRG
jgi:capsular polysaccharide biosynthesis protein